MFHKKSHLALPQENPGVHEPSLQLILCIAMGWSESLGQSLKCLVIDHDHQTYTHIEEQFTLLPSFIVLHFYS